MRSFLFVFSLIAFVSCGKGGKESAPEKKSSTLDLSAEALKQAQFTVAPVGAGVVRRSVQLQGSIKANQDSVTSIISHVSGIALKIPKQLGAKVKKGDILLELNSKEMGQAQLNYINLHRKMSFSYSRLKMEKGIWQKKIGSKLSYLRANEDFNKATLARDMEAQKLRLLGVSAVDIKKLPSRPKSKLTVYILRSPVDGVLIKKSISRGEIAKTDAPVFIIANLSTVWLDIKVPVEYLNSIVPKQKVDIYSGKLKKTIKGEVIYVSPTADAKSRAALVRILLSNKSGQWRPGLCAMAEFVVKRKSVPLVVPKSAVVQMYGKPSLFVEVKKGSFLMKSVILGDEDKKVYEIKGGVKSGERVVVDNVVNLKGEWLATMGE